MQAYSDVSRESGTYSLPDLEVFYLDYGDKMAKDWPELTPGWYYWYCFPGCLPDSEPMGPFATEDEALADAQDITDDEERSNGPKRY